MDMPLDVQETATAPAPRSFEPHMPKSVEETGLGLGFLADLAIKIMYFGGYISGYEIAEAMKLPFAGVVDEVLEFLKREQFCEVKGAAGGLGESAYQYVISSKGSEKAREVLDRGQYVGPTPVPLEDYTDAFRKQPLQNIAIHQKMMQQALSHLVLDQRIYNQLGPAVNSCRSIFLYGPPGNGKTTVAESIGMMIFIDNIYVPYAVEVDGQIIKVFDSINHRSVEGGGAGSSRMGNKIDKRWVKIHRPFIVTGGELTLESLDLVYDSTSKYYEAPFQMRANGGMFLVDDFGRQQIRPRDLLNRWIVPLEKRADFLTLHTGRKIEIPFDVLIVFATNLAPTDLVDEAFLRRIRHKIELRDPSFEEFREIFKRVCAHKGVPYDDQALAYILQEHYIKPQVPLRACHPRDLIDQLIDIARYQNRPPVLTKDLIDQACEAYFVELK